MKQDCSRRLPLWKNIFCTNNNQHIRMSFLKKHALFLFFAGWLVLNLVQAGGTELFDDEAYYWVYAQFPAWGYYDHPPMIALLIKAGYAIFHNELGVRLFIALFSTATLVFIYDLLPRKNNPLFFTIAASVAVLQIGGIIAVPDIPLTFFVAVFFWCYRRFLQRGSFANALLLGLSMALMLYSKYHGILIIVFTLLSNIKLFKQPKAWLAAGFGAILFLPHLYWQWVHGFPSVQYHLFERNASSYKFSFTTEYILGQLLLAGPLMGWLLLWQAFACRVTGAFERALKFSLAGFYIFFLVSTLKGRVEANWTVPILVPLIILSHQALLDKTKWAVILWKSVPFTLLLVMLARIYMLLDIGPVKGVPKDEFHLNKRWAEAIKSRTDGRPVVFIDTYQKASKYWFYSGIPSFSLNTPDYRRSNYNFWPVERNLQGNPVYVVSALESTYFTDSLPNPFGVWGGHRVDSFYSHSGIVATSNKILTVKNNRLEPAPVSLGNNEPFFYTKLPSLMQYPILIAVYHGEELKGYFPLAVTPISGRTGTITAGINLPAGRYTAKFVIPSVVPNRPTLNSTVFSLRVE
jgi:hypothetical protein